MNITKNLKNLRHSVYKVGEICKRPLPHWVASLLSIGNRTPLPSAAALVTYDGSGQACHPTVTPFQGKLYMACTPYPYGKEFYENPCVYTWETSHWQPVSGAFPVVCPHQPGFEHYSDPCLFCRDGSLYLLFRKCERRESGKVDQLYMTSTSNGTDWDAPRLLAEGKGDSLISPAVGTDTRELFCVEYDGAVNSRLVRYGFTNTAALGEKSACEISGLDETLFVWHIDVAYEPDGAVRGLFMLREKCAETVSRLALFTFAPETNTWRWERDLSLTESEQRNIRYIYKSAFTERSDRILCSACDKKGRYFLFEKAL